MAIALVSAGTVATGSTSVAPAFGASTKLGNLLIAQIVGSGGTGSITCSNPNWTLAPNAPLSSRFTVIFYRQNALAGETAPTFSLTTATAMNAILSEWSGAVTSGPNEQGAGVNGSTTPSVASMAANDTTASQLCIAAVAITVSKSATVTWTPTWTPTLGTAGVTASDSGTSTATHLNGNYYLLNGHGGAAHDQLSMAWTLSTGTVNTVGMALATFKEFIPFTGPFSTEQGQLRDDPRSIQALGQAVKRSAYYCLGEKWARKKSGLIVPAADRQFVLA